MRYSGLICLAVAAVPARGQEPRADRYGDPLPPGAVARIGTVRLRSSLEISHVALSPDGKWLVTGGKVWDTATGAIVREIGWPLSEEADRVTRKRMTESLVAVAFGADSRRLHAVTQAGKLRACDLSDGTWSKPLARTDRAVDPWEYAWGGPSPDGTHFFYRPGVGKPKATEVLAIGRDTPVYRLDAERYGRPRALTADNRFVAAVATDGAGTLWDLKADTAVCARRPPDGVLFDFTVSPDGKTVVAVCGPEHRRLFGRPAPPETTLYAWDVATGKELYRARGWEGYEVLFSPDGARFVSLLGKEVLVGDAKTGKLVHRLTGHGAWAIFGYAFSADGKRLATGSRDHSAVVWDLTTGTAALDFDSPRGPVDVVAVSPDGRTVFAGCAEDHTGGLWDADTGRRRHRLDADGKGNPLSAAFTPDGKHVVVGYGQSRATSTGDAWTARLWSVADGKVVREFGGHTDGVHQLAVSPDGSRLATRDFGKKVRVWDLATGKLTREVEWAAYNEPFALAFPAAGELIGVTADRARGTEVRNLLAGKAVAAWRATSREITFAASPDGRLVVAVEYPWGLTVRDGTAGTVVSTLRSVRPGSLTIAAFSPDGKTVAVSGISGAGMADTVHLFDTATGKELRSFPAHAGMVCALAFSPDGKRLVTGSWDSTALVWDLSALP